MAIWDGLVQSRIANLLQCDFKETLCKSYSAVWKSIAAPVGSRVPRDRNDVTAVNDRASMI